MEPMYKHIDKNVYKVSNTLKDYRQIKCNCKYNRLEIEKNCGPKSACTNRTLLIECDPEICDCGDLCQNLQFTRKKYSSVQVKGCGEKGKGVFAAENMEKEEFIMEYVGEIISIKMYESRIRTSKHVYCMKLDAGSVIDAQNMGNESRFINHSCDPNAETQKWIVDGQPRIGIFAIKNISIGEEITFNYNFVTSGDSLQKCMCGSKKCTGSIGSLRKKTQETNEFEEQAAHWIRAKDQIMEKENTILEFMDFLYYMEERDLRRFILTPLALIVLVKAAYRWKDIHGEKILDILYILPFKYWSTPSSLSLVKLVEELAEKHSSKSSKVLEKWCLLEETSPLFVPKAANSNDVAKFRSSSSYRI